MSYKLGMDTLNLRPTPRLAHTEYCSHAELIKTVTGEKAGWLTPKFCDAWDIDFFWHTNDGPVNWANVGRTTDMGHAEFLDAGSDKRQSKPSPFTDPEQVLEFDAVQEYGLPDTAELTQFYDRHYRDGRKKHPEQVFTGGYYKTIVSGAIEAFGWDMLLEAAADRERFARVLDSFFRLSLHHYQAWAKTSCEVFICHDDMVWTSGAFVAPEFYRQTIFPRYRELWAVLKKAGKKLLFCSDGNWTQFIDDIAAAGADGFIFEPMTDLDQMVAKYGKTHVIVSSKVDCRTLTFGTKAQIQAEIDASLKLARNCSGFMFAVGNHIPCNVPIENALFYMDYLRKNWSPH